jgi:arylsulfatase
VALVTWLAGCGEPQSSVVLVTIDTLRADHLPTYGYRGIATPNLDAFAARGVVFRRAFSAASATAPSHASMLTGRYPSFHSIGLENGRFALGEGTPTVAEILKEEGFATGAVVSNPILRSPLGLSRGFDSYDDRLEGSEAIRKTRERYADRAVELALRWLDEHGRRRFFFWLHLQDPHGPYVPRDPSLCPPLEDTAAKILPFGTDHSGYGAIPDYQRYGDEQRAADYVRRYDCEIVYADHHLGALLKLLAEDARFQRTLVIVTADHGEALGEDGFFFAHTHSVGLDQVWVPLIVAGPGVPAGRAVQRAVSNMWVFATVLDYLEVAGPEENQGQSLLPLARDETAAAAPIFVESLSQSGAIDRGVFLRHDRYPASDRAFWDRGVPGTGATLVPLGRQTLSLAGLSVEEQTPTGVEELLDLFDATARVSRTAIAEVRKERASLSREELEALRALGYH